MSLAVVLESRIWPPWPASPIREAWWTAKPTYPSSPTVASPVWTPIRIRTRARSGHSWPRHGALGGNRGLTAVPALRKTAKKESPWRSISMPPASSKALRSSSLWSERSFP